LRLGLTFAAVLAQVLALRQQQVAYCVVKRHFALDANDLEGLKEARIYAARPAGSVAWASMRSTAMLFGTTIAGGRSGHGQRHL